MPRYTEAELLDAISHIQAGMPLRQASRLFKVPHTTIRSRMQQSRPSTHAPDRLRQPQPQPQAQQHQPNHPLPEPRRPLALPLHLQRLTPQQESGLVAWVVAQQARGLSVAPVQIRVIVKQILAAGGDNRPLGHNWMRTFFRRNPALQPPRVQPRPASHLNPPSLPLPAFAAPPSHAPIAIGPLPPQPPAVADAMLALYDPLLVDPSMQHPDFDLLHYGFARTAMAGYAYPSLAAPFLLSDSA